MPCSYSFINSKGEAMNLCFVEAACEQWEIAFDKMTRAEIEERKLTGKGFSMYDVLTWVAISGNTVDEYITKVKEGIWKDERVISVLEYLKTAIDLYSFSSFRMPSSLLLSEPPITIKKPAINHSNVVSNSLTGISKKKRKNVRMKIQNNH